MRRPVSSLPSTADRAAILSHPGWRVFHDLPVVDQGGRFVGVLRHETVRRLETEGLSAVPHERVLGTALAFGELCWVTLSKVIGEMATLAVLPPSRRRGEQEVNRGKNT